MSRTMQRTVSVLVAFITALVVMLAGAPAHSAPLDRPGAGVTRTPAPLGTGWRWGVQPSQLPVCQWGTTDFDDRGGWSSRRQISETFLDTYPYTSEPDRPDRPFVIQWDEPCYQASESIPSDRIRVPLLGYSLPVAISPTSSPARWLAVNSLTVGGTTVPTALFCAGSEWSTSYTERPWTRGVGVGLSAPSNTATVSDGSGELARSMYVGNASGITCPYLVGMRVIFCSFSLPDPPPYTGKFNVRNCEAFVWMAENWYRGDAYSTTPLDVELCRAGVHSLDCAYIDPPEEFTWDRVCGVGMPGYGSGPSESPNWGDQWWSAAVVWVFGVWAPWFYELVNSLVEHYARCIFVPPAGWDSQGRIDAAWGSSSFSDVYELIGQTGAAFFFTESCGVVANLPEVLSSAPIDTCEWVTWALPVKEFLTWSAWIGFGFWAIWFAVQLFLAAVRATPVPNPLVMDVSDARAAERAGS